MSPKSSSPVLIWRRSSARIVPSSTGSSYCLPVRLSVMERVSAMLVAVGSKLVFGVVTVCHGLGGYAVVLREPSPEIGHLAALAAEGGERGRSRTPPTVRARRGV